MKTIPTAETTLKQKFLNLYHRFTLSDEWEGSLEEDAEKIALEHTASHIEALRIEFKEKAFWSHYHTEHLLTNESIDKVINNQLKELK